MRSPRRPDAGDEGLESRSDLVLVYVLELFARAYDPVEACIPHPLREVLHHLKGRASEARLALVDIYVREDGNGEDAEAFAVIERALVARLRHGTQCRIARARVDGYPVDAGHTGQIADGSSHGVADVVDFQVPKDLYLRLGTLFADDLGDGPGSWPATGGPSPIDLSRHRLEAEFNHVHLRAQALQ